MRFNTTSKRSFPEENRILQTIPGVNENCAATILAEIGPTVTAFPSDAHLASWAGRLDYAQDLMRVLALKNPHTLRKEIDISNRL